MDNTTKRNVLIVIVILAVALAGFSIMHTVKASEGKNVGVLGGGPVPPDGAPGLKSQMMGQGQSGQPAAGPKGDNRLGNAAGAPPGAGE